MTFETVVTVFLVLLPIWQERPAAPGDLYPSSYPLVVTQEQIDGAVAGFAFGDFGLRDALVQDLGKTGSNYAAAVLWRQLVTENVPELRAGILLQLHNLPLAASTPAQVAPLLAAGDPRERRAAVRLYAELADADWRLLLDRAEADHDQAVRRIAAQGLIPLGDDLQWEDLAALREVEDRVIRAAAWQASCHAADAPEFADLLRVAARDVDPYIRTAVATVANALPPELAVGLCTILAKDAHPTVRTLAAARAGERPAEELLAVLLTLAEDEDAEVRRQAVASLVAYPVAAAAEMILKHFADPSPFARAAGEESAVAMHPRFNLIDGATTALKHADPNARFRAYHVLGRLKAGDRNQEIAEALGQEVLPTNLAAGLIALFQVGNKGFSARIIGLAGHDDENVRAAAAMALSHIHEPAALAMVGKLIDDPRLVVGNEAILAAGRLGDPSFGPALLRVLKDTGMTAHFSSRERSSACWSVARIEPLDKATAQRLVAQATTPVIQTPMGPIFEPDYVLVNACHALVAGALRDAAVRPLAEAVIAKHAQPVDRRELIGPGTLVPTPELTEYARQAAAYLNGEAAVPGLRPTRSMRLVYRPLK